MGQQQHGSVSHKLSAVTINFPFLCPVISHLRAAAPGALASPSCDDILPLPLPRLQSSHVLLVFSLQALCNLWDGLISAPVELVALLTLVLAGREVGCWMEAPAFSELGVTAGTQILRRREGPDYRETKYQGSFILKTSLNLNINETFSSWFWWSFWCLSNTTPVSELFYPSFSQRSRIIHCWAVLSTDKEQSLCKRWPLVWMFEAGNQVFSLSKQNTEFCNLDTLVSAFFSPHLTPCVWHVDTVGKG